MRRAGATTGAALLAVMVLGAAGCGTRLPDSAFRAGPSPSSSPGVTATPTATVGPDGLGPGVIRIGTIASRTNFFDPRAFVGPSYGVRAFVDAVNARGGIAGRHVELVTCDDQGSASGNASCVRRLIDDDHVFVFVGNAILNYGGAFVVQQRGVPDIGGQPIDTAYTRYSHLWDIAGEGYPRNGQIGYAGKLRSGTETPHFFKVHFPNVPLRAGVVMYNQSASARWGAALATALRIEGYAVTSVQVNFALPDYDSAAIAMKHAGVRYVYDSLDRTGNEQLCKALDENRVSLVAKVTTTQSWDAAVRSDYAASPVCRNVLFATGSARNYEDTQYPAVADFRAAMAAHGWDTPQTMSDWALEGWAGAQWFADAVQSCATTLTRACVERFIGSGVPYDAHGLLTPRAFDVGSPNDRRTTNCIDVARWSDAANSGRGGWVTQVADMNTNCFDVPTFPYSP